MHGEPRGRVADTVILKEGKGDVLSQLELNRFPHASVLRVLLERLFVYLQNWATPACFAGQMHIRKEIRKTLGCFTGVLSSCNRIEQTAVLVAVCLTHVVAAFRPDASWEPIRCAQRTCCFFLLGLGVARRRRSVVDAVAFVRESRSTVVPYFVFSVRSRDSEEAKDVACAKKLMNH